jgi:hypothetical protein
MFAAFVCFGENDGVSADRIKIHFPVIGGAQKSRWDSMSGDLADGIGVAVRL